jgi:teichoic acid transport system permease protein
MGDRNQGDSMTTTTPSGAGAAALAAAHGLAELGGRPPLTVYVRQLWERRYFAIELARSRFRAQNEADRLGAAWIVLLPTINAAVYGLVFGVIVKSASRPHHFIPFLVTGVFTFAFFSGCFSDGAKSIISNRGLVRTLHFPRAVLPIASVLQQLFALGPVVLVMCLIVLISGEPISARWLMILPAYFLMALFCAGVAFFAARLTIHVRDVAQLIPFITRLLFYVSGIFFAVSEKFNDHETLTTVLKINPVNVYITLVRDALLSRDHGLEGVHADPSTWQFGIIWGVVMFAAGFLFFWRAEGLYGRD